jgi:hypothetical protein
MRNIAGAGGITFLHTVIGGVKIHPVAIRPAAAPAGA